MSAPPSEIKARLRQELRAVLRNMPPEARAADSERLVARLREQPSWKSARAVLLFMPVGHEPDIRSLLGDALDQGKAVALPRHSALGDFYQPCQIQSLMRDLRAGLFGVSEPGPDCPIFPANQLDFALVPGVGFALDGGRLGRGKGYYDRLLAEIPGFKCGAAFDGQVLSDLPLEDHDVRLNCILTPTRWQVVSPAPVLK